MTDFDLGDHVWIDPQVRDLYRWDEHTDDAVLCFADDEDPPVAGEIVGLGWDSRTGSYVTVEWTAPWTYADGAAGTITQELCLDPSLVLHVPTATIPGHDHAATALEPAMNTADETIADGPQRCGQCGRAYPSPHTSDCPVPRVIGALVGRESERPPRPAEMADLMRTEPA